MPGSLLSVNRKVKRQDSTRSDVSTYSNDSKKKVSFNKAVRVKKYTRSEEGDKDVGGGRRFWFKVYKDVDPDLWQEYSGDDKYRSDDKLKTIDEFSTVNRAEEPEKRNNVRSMVEKFNREAAHREEDDTLTKQKKNYILNGVKALFNSSSLRNKKSPSVRDRNLENLFLNQSYDRLLSDQHELRNNRIGRIPEDYEGNLRRAGEEAKAVDVRKWESGDGLILDARRNEKSVEQSDKGRWSRTVQERDRIWENVTRSVTYAQSSAKEVESDSARRWRGDGAARRNTAAKSSDNYKVTRPKNGTAWAYGDVPLPDKDKRQINKSGCSRDRCYGNAENRSRRECARQKSERESRRAGKISSRESSPFNKSDSSDYRREYSAPGNSGRRNRKTDDPPTIQNVRITVNGEEVDGRGPRGGLAAAFNHRQRARNTGSGSGSEAESTHRHKTVFLYIPGISHRQRSALADEESASTLKKSSSLKGKRPSKYRYHGNGAGDPSDFDSTEEVSDERRFT
ncbi:uncharacterized protein [Centruroides vittatus]|uniref:uncharacterized protein n=1 Tax=Centruroides vittatus TaxID=120091 RepID=UPI00350F12C2